LDAQPLLLAVEIGARFPDEQPSLRVTRALGSIGGGPTPTTTTKRRAPASAELAETGGASISNYPWSPRWPPEEQAARIYNHLASALTPS
jgi:hypothetical protein